MPSSLHVNERCLSVGTVGLKSYVLISNPSRRMTTKLHCPCPCNSPFAFSFAASTRRTHRRIRNRKRLETTSFMTTVPTTTKRRRSSTTSKLAFVSLSEQRYPETMVYTIKLPWIGGHVIQMFLSSNVFLGLRIYVRLRWDLISPASITIRLLDYGSRDRPLSLFRLCGFLK